MSPSRPFKFTHWMSFCTSFDSKCGMWHISTNRLKEYDSRHRFDCHISLSCVPFMNSAEQFAYSIGGAAIHAKMKTHQEPTWMFIWWHSLSPTIRTIPYDSQFTIHITHSFHFVLYDFRKMFFGEISNEMTTPNEIMWHIFCVKYLNAILAGRLWLYWIIRWFWNAPIESI